MAELFYGVLVFLLIILFANMFLLDFVDDKEIVDNFKKAKEKVDNEINNASNKS